MCTLRAAIMQANYATGTQTITLPPGVYLLTRVASDDTAVAGDLDIDDSLILQGAGSAATIVDGGVTNDRVFQILSSATAVTMTGLTIRNGQALTTTNPSFIGGGIYRDGNSGSFGSRLLYLSNVVIEDNISGDGGGLYATSGQVILDNTSLRANTATYRGGGFYAKGSLLTIRNSQVYSNTAGEGGGLALSEIYDGRIEHAEIYSNTASTSGGGMQNSSSNANLFSHVTLLDSDLHDNHAVYNGGPIDNYSSLIISRSVLDANTAGKDGSGILIYQTYIPSSMLVDQSTPSHDSAQYERRVH